MCCVLALMVIIFAFSAQDGESSDEHSHCIADPVGSLIEATSGESFETQEAKTEHFTALKAKLNTAFRKCAHVFLYGLLGAFLFLYIVSIGKTPYTANIFAMLISILYAASDEVHQHFTVSRNGHFEDVCIDLFGTAVVLILIYAVNAAGRKRERR